jgi:hypothetical protein
MYVETTLLYNICDVESSEGEIMISVSKTMVGSGVADTDIVVGGLGLCVHRSHTSLAI